MLKLKQLYIQLNNFNNFKNYANNIFKSQKGELDGKAY
ncbi:hypothetical protein B4102_3989 [Heyndrickxia sporothermodurans]|uniref:Uncharacterized protein n=1 Tax=Heyndrickxia sporothermodurans TaxID=46224 RepID=A0A150KK74_9BACI|nr:hypothetical protein B4102_3989 [Heyndrickxia sporothermodurans]